MVYSNGVNPVALPPGFAKLSTKPAPTGSATSTNTIGVVRVAFRSATTGGLPVAILPRARVQPIPSRIGATHHHRLQSSDTRCADFGPQSTPIAVVADGMPQCVPERLRRLL